MNDSLLGIDLGTSSVKVLLRHADGRIEKAKATYAHESPLGWWQAVCEALQTLDLSTVSAIGLSSQVGTYIVNGADVIGWRDRAGEAELQDVLDRYPREIFLREIAMPHPRIISYPLPRLGYIKKHVPSFRSVCQPKDLLIERLTGNLVSDPYSWRGLADPNTQAYSAYFLHALGIDSTCLPPLRAPTDLAGTITQQAARDTGLPVSTPVYLGMNDFFASIVGMGITAQNGDQMFDITGTSEHLGIVSDRITLDTEMVWGPYPDGFVHYGVTASSGTSLAFGLREFGESQADAGTVLAQNPPIFLPYLSGERMPVLDPTACGVFFGLRADCTKEMLSYAVREGVAFSLYHIYESIKIDSAATEIRVSGGASKDALLCTLKAELFQKSFVTLREQETSALGAAMVAGVGCGQYPYFADAARACCHTEACYQPSGTLRDTLLCRYEIYKHLYPNLKSSMRAFYNLSN